MLSAFASPHELVQLIWLAALLVLVASMVI
jgi:hypothetical protein